MSALRNLSVDEVLATARRHLVGHVRRDQRVNDALKLARNNVIRIDAARLASVRVAPMLQDGLQRQAAMARRERVKRTLGAARDTLKRVSHIKPPSRMSGGIVHRTTENARVAPEAPSPAPRRQEEAPPPLADAIENLSCRFEVLREAVPQAIAKMLADLRTEWRRENDGLRRELDVIHRELDLVRRALADLRALPS